MSDCKFENQKCKLEEVETDSRTYKRCSEDDGGESGKDMMKMEK